MNEPIALDIWDMADRLPHILIVDEVCYFKLENTIYAVLSRKPLGFSTFDLWEAQPWNPTDVAPGIRDLVEQEFGN